MACAQEAPSVRPPLENPAFDEMLIDLLPFETSLISVQDVQDQRDKFILLDTRSEKEFQVSHIPGAVWVGYGSELQLETIEALPRDVPIALYCSVGYRSDKVGQVLVQKLGFDKVHNIYGSIFEWSNQGLPLESISGTPTNRLHTYSKSWSRWVSDSVGIKKVW